MSSPHLQVYLSHRKALVRYAARLLGNPTQAEDIVQEAWLRLAPETSCRSPISYLYRIVHNLAIDSGRQVRVQRQDEHSERQLAELPAPQHCPASAALYADQLRALQRALERLPKRTQDAFYLHRIEGLTFPRIAERLGISVGLAHQLVRDALTYCAACLDE